jgi:YidC/Oxa1 family membrane protein insertase
MAIKEKYKNREEQALKVMEFYKTNNINPFSSIFTILFQIPIVFSLYYIFFRSGLPIIDTNLIYSFIKAPASVSMTLFGFIDMSQKSIILALLAAASTFGQMHLSSPNTLTNNQSGNTEDFAKIMAKQMKYTMPIVVFLVSWKISAVVSLYWFVSNLIGIAQDFYIKRQLKTI